MNKLIRRSFLLMLAIASFAVAEPDDKFNSLERSLPLDGVSVIVQFFDKMDRFDRDGLNALSLSPFFREDAFWKSYNDGYYRASPERLRSVSMKLIGVEIIEVEMFYRRVDVDDIVGGNRYWFTRSAGGWRFIPDPSYVKVQSLGKSG